MCDIYTGHDAWLYEFAYNMYCCKWFIVQVFLHDSDIKDSLGVFARAQLMSTISSYNLQQSSCDSYIEEMYGDTWTF